ncbi:MAG: MFS transporter [Candidatus Limnocylindrales bacterium]
MTLLHIGIISGFTFLGLRITELGEVPRRSRSRPACRRPWRSHPCCWPAGSRGGSACAVCSPRVPCCTGRPWVTWTVLDVPAAIIATRAMTGVAFAGVIVSVVLTIAELLPRELQATGQALYQTTAFGVAAVIANAIGGRLYESVGHSALFGLGAILALAAAILGWLMFPHRTAGPTRELAPG